MNQAILVRGKSISASIEEIEQAVKDLAGEVTADNAERLTRCQAYARRVLHSLLSARTDLGTLALAVADDGTAI